MAEMMWELRNLSTDEVLEGPMPLPENWGPIFGMRGFKDKIGNLSWVTDPRYSELGWIETNTPAEESVDAVASTPDQVAWTEAKKLLWASDWTMLPDVPMTVGEKQLWIDYRSELRNIRSQAGFPENINWPISPE